MLPLKECKIGFIAHLQGKAGEEPLSWAVDVNFYSNEVKDKQEMQATHTYDLIEAKIFIKAKK